MHPKIAEDMSRVKEILREKGCIKDLDKVEESECLIPEGGKMIRPRLVTLAARLCGYDGTAHIDYAASVELIHNATLFHDDVIDSGEIRRGGKTLNVRFGNSFALLAGDYLMAKSFCLIAKCENPEILSAIADCFSDLVYGQLKEMDHDRDIDTPMDVYYKITDNKTASLIKTCLVIGGLLAGADQQTLNLLAETGSKTGRLFQIADDVIDYLAGENRTGKRRFHDVREGKMTMPAILLVRRCAPDERELFRTLLGKRDMAESDGMRIVTLLEKYKIINEIHAEYFRMHEDVTRLLGKINGNEFLPDFKALIDLIIGRLYSYTDKYLKDDGSEKSPGHE
ncbi:MAG: polyprenyl synthetase family protein [bacterium]